MTDIVERLRNDDVVWGVRPSLAFEAADEIEKLREERNRLREALQSIARNTCCEGCQEAALVARGALKEKE